MTRVEFTKNICSLISEMVTMGEHPIFDFCKRSTEEQKRLFEEGLSKCDGVNNISKHQTGRAMDIYFIEDGKMSSPNRGHEHWHRVWTDKLGGAEIIDWDKGHYE